jgi:hypothetical protein
MTETCPEIGLGLQDESRAQKATIIARVNIRFIAMSNFQKFAIQSKGPQARNGWEFAEKCRRSDSRYRAA